MSFMDGVDLNDTFEPATHSDGTEVKLRISDAEVRKGDKGQYFFVRIEDPEDFTIKDINHIMMVPSKDDNPKVQNARKRAINDFCEAFGVDVPSVETVEEASQYVQSNWPGNSAWAILRHSEDPEYGEQNRIRKFVKG